MAKGLLLYFDIDTGYYPGLHHGLAYLMGSVKSRAENSVEFIHVFREERPLRGRDKAGCTILSC